MKTTPSSLSPQAAVDNSYIESEPLDAVKLLAQAHHPSCGAIVLFSGEVRDNSNKKEVAYLEYEAFDPMANKVIRTILSDAKAKWPLNIAIAQHRVGKVAVGESAVIVITATAHRKEAYQANRYIIDRIKHEAPIWKCEYFTDGSHEWGGNCNCQKVTGDPHQHLYEFGEVEKS